MQWPNTATNERARFNGRAQSNNANMIAVANLELACKLRRHFGKHLRLQFREMTEKTRHAARRMMFSQSICSQHERKPRITRRCELILPTRKPVLRRISLARIEFIRHGRLERLVMRGKRSVLQTFRHVNPAQAILMQDERRITRNCIETFGAYLRLKVGSFTLYESGNIDAGPFFGVPPH